MLPQQSHQQLACQPKKSLAGETNSSAAWETKELYLRRAHLVVYTHGGALSPYRALIIGRWLIESSGIDVLELHVRSLPSRFNLLNIFVQSMNGFRNNLHEWLSALKTNRSQPAFPETMNYTTRDWKSSLRDSRSFRLSGKKVVHLKEESGRIKLHRIIRAHLFGVLKSVMLVFLHAQGKLLTIEGMSLDRRQIVAETIRASDYGFFSCRDYARLLRACINWSLMNEESKRCEALSNESDRTIYCKDYKKFIYVLDNCYTNGVILEHFCKAGSQVIEESASGFAMREYWSSALRTLSSSRQNRESNSNIRPDQYMDLRLKDPSAVLQYMGKSSASATGRPLENHIGHKRKGVIAVIFLHSFRDAQFSYGFDGYNGVWDWAVSSVSALAKNSKVEKILIKSHPNQVSGPFPEHKFLMQLDNVLKIYPFEWLPVSTSIKELSQFHNLIGLTHHGSVAEELAWCSVPIFVSQCSPYGYIGSPFQCWPHKFNYEGILAEIDKSHLGSFKVRRADLIAHLVSQRQMTLTLKPNNPKKMLYSAVQYECGMSLRTSAINLPVCEAINLLGKGDRLNALDKFMAYVDYSYRCESIAD